MLNEEQREIQALTRKIVDEQVVPIRSELDKAEKFPWDQINLFADSGLFGVFVEEKYGGFGGAMTDWCVVTDEISRGCLGVSTAFAGVGLGAFPIIIDGSEELKERYLPDIAAGKSLAAFALTEADAGSDATGIRTTAVRDGDHYVINGTKQWITNAEVAKTYAVVAMTNPAKGARGASVILVEKDTPGFTFGKLEKKMGINCSSTRELIFEDCRVPVSNLIGREGAGFIVTMKTLNRARVGVGAQAVGLCRGAVELTVDYSRQRKQFDRPICSFQAVQHILADMATQTEAARALLYSTTRSIDGGEKNFAKMAAMVKLFGSDVAMKVTTDAVQVFGGYGYMREYPVEKMMRDAKILQIYEGTNQIQRNEIGTALVKEAASRKRKK
jgi:butyryl-CoA dehydrogenase